jgi:hypothetical protein
MVGYVEALNAIHFTWILRETEKQNNKRTENEKEMDKECEIISSFDEKKNSRISKKNEKMKKKNQNKEMDKINENEWKEDENECKELNEKNVVLNDNLTNSCINSFNSWLRNLHTFLTGVPKNDVSGVFENQQPEGISSFTPLFSWDNTSSFSLFHDLITTPLPLPVAVYGGVLICFTVMCAEERFK